MICLWLQNGAHSKVPRYQPAVKFRKINKDTLEKLRNINLDDPSGEQMNNEDETADPSDNGNPNSADTVTNDAPPKPNTEFLIDSDVDINSVALLDMISEEEAVQILEPMNTQPLETAPSWPLTVDEALEMWD